MHRTSSQQEAYAHHQLLRMVFDPERMLDQPRDYRGGMREELPAAHERRDNGIKEKRQREPGHDIQRQEV